MRAGSGETSGSRGCVGGGVFRMDPLFPPSLKFQFRRPSRNRYENKKKAIDHEWGARSVCDLRSIARSTGNLRRPLVQRNAPCSYPHQCMAQRIFKRVSRRQREKKKRGGILNRFSTRSVHTHTHRWQAKSVRPTPICFCFHTISLITAAGGRRVH